MKKLFCFILTSTFLLINRTGICADNIIVHYNFNSETITQNANNNYIIKDISGNEYNATSTNASFSNNYNGISATDKEGISGNFVIPNEAFFGMTDFTISFWTLIDTQTRPSYPILNFGNVKLYPSWGSGIVRLCSYFENDKEIYSPKYDYSYDENLYMHTIVKDGDKIKMYLNGEEITDTITNKKSTVTLNDMVALGTIFEVKTMFMDEFIAYSNALTSIEISELYNNALNSTDNKRIKLKIEVSDENISYTMDTNNLNGDLYVALYDSKDFLVGMTYGNATGSFNKLKPGDYTIKAFLWNEYLSPVCNTDSVHCKILAE